MVSVIQQVDLSAEAFLLNDSPREEYWAAAIEAGIARARSPATYRKLVSKQLVGMLLFVYVRSEMAPHVHGVATDSAGYVLGVYT